MCVSGEGRDEERKRGRTGGGRVDLKGTETNKPQTHDLMVQAAT